MFMTYLHHTSKNRVDFALQPGGISPPQLRTNELSAKSDNYQIDYLPSISPS